MQTENKNSKLFVGGLGFISYGLMFVMGVIFYKERVVMCDAAFQLFSILKNDSFAIQINRFGAACTQIFPLLTAKCGGDIQTVTLMYSLSFLIFYLLVFIIVLKVLKNEKIALVILLFNTLMVRHSFFWIQCEFVQGAVLTLLLLAVTDFVVRRPVIPRWYYPLSFVLIITIIYFYPLLVFIILFGFGFLMLENRKKVKWLGLVLGTYLLLYLMKIIFHSNFYDQQSMHGIKNIISEFPNYFALKSFQNFYSYVRHDYYLLFLFWLLTALHLCWKKKILHFLWMSAFLFGVCFLINVNFKQGVDQFYLESQYLILVVFVAMPFAYFLFTDKKLFPFTLILLVGSIGLSLVRINATHKLYARRVDYVRQLCSESPTKRIMPKEKVNTEMLRFIWGVSFEAWLLSGIESGKTVSVVYEEQAGQFDYLLGDPKMFITQMGLYAYPELNEKYFHKDSLSNYRKY